MDMAEPVLGILVVFGLLATFVLLTRHLAGGKARCVPPTYTRSGSPFTAAGIAQLFRSPLPRWMRPGGDATDLIRVRQLALTPTHRVHLVRIQGSEVILITHPQGCDWHPLTGELAASPAFIARDQEKPEHEFAEVLASQSDFDFGGISWPPKPSA